MNKQSRWNSIDIKVRKSKIEGLAESYFGENVNIEIEINDFKDYFAEQLISDLESKFEEKNKDFNTQPFIDNGNIKYSKLVEFIDINSSK